MDIYKPCTLAEAFRTKNTKMVNWLTGDGVNFTASITPLNRDTSLTVLALQNGYTKIAHEAIKTLLLSATTPEYFAVPYAVISCMKSNGKNGVKQESCLKQALKKVIIDLAKDKVTFAIMGSIVSKANEILKTRVEQGQVLGRDQDAKREFWTKVKHPWILAFLLVSSDRRIIETDTLKTCNKILFNKRFSLAFSRREAPAAANSAANSAVDMHEAL